MKQKLLKTMRMFLAAALLGVGTTSAWAGDKTVVKYSFDDANSPSLTAGSRVTLDYSHTSVITSTTFLNMTNNANGAAGSSTISLGSEDLSGETWTLTFEWAANGGCNGKTGHTYLKAGDTNLFDIVDNANWNTANQLTYGESSSVDLSVPACNKSNRFGITTADLYNTTAYWYHFVITGSDGGVKLTVTNSSTGDEIVKDAVLSETNVSPTSIVANPSCGGALGFDELSLTYYVEGEVIQTPIAAYTAVNGINRTITATCETEGATIQYSTDGTNWTAGASVTVSESGNVYFKAVKGTSESDVLTFAAEAGEAITLNAPSIVRSNNTTVTITADQTDKLLSPTATIYYEYGAESGSFTGSKVLTVAADATITAYAEATGYTTSATSELAVALFPTNVEAIESTASKTSGWSENAFSGDTKTVSERTYAALMLDGTQWGTNVYFQTDGAWGFRANGSWYINSNTEESWILMPSMKAGDIVVVDASYPASSTVNATYSKYSYGTKHAYEVTADGDVELALKKINATTMDYLYGVYAYRTVTAVSTTLLNTYGTIASAYALDCANLPTGLTAYQVTSIAADKVTLTQMTEAVAAGTGLILKGTGGETYDIPVVASGTDISATNKLKAAVTATDVDADAAYVLYKDEFRKVTNASSVPAGKAYLLATDVPAEARELTFDFGDATGISAIAKSQEPNANGYYNLAGQRVAQPQKGLYIQDGKKVIIK